MAQSSADPRDAYRRLARALKSVVSQQSTPVGRADPLASDARIAVIVDRQNEPTGFCGHA